jgi:hypothetical protein
VRDNDTVNRSVRGNANVINDPVNRVTQKFEAGDERNIEFPGRKFIAERRWMIEVHIAFPTADKRAGVEIFYATYAEGVQCEMRLVRGEK